MRHRTGMCSNCDNPEARHDYCPNCGHGDPLHAATESELERLRAENARLAEALEMVVKGPRYVSDPRPYDLADAAAILKQHNVWRRWNGDWDEEDGPEPVGPSELGRAIDMVVTHIESLTPADQQSPPPPGCSTASGS